MDPLFRTLLNDVPPELNRPGERAILGLMLLCYFAGTDKKAAVNHVLLEGLNGVAKTTLVKAFSQAIAGPTLRKFLALTRRGVYTRLQGGPDLSPADVLGYDLLQAGQPKYTFGPFLVVKPVHYFDEINRSPSKTQSCVLESMAEGGNVTITTMDESWRYRRTIRLPAFFMVGSQNPDVQEGTFPLPEAVLDRFIVKITVPFTDRLADLVAGGEPSFDDDPSDLAADLERLATGCELQALRDSEEDETAFQPGFRPYVRWIRTQEHLRGCLDERLRNPRAIVGQLARPPRSNDDVAFADRIETLLTALQHLKLDALRKRVRETPLAPDDLKDHPKAVPHFIAALVYNTWSKESYKEAVGGLSKDEKPPFEQIPYAQIPGDMLKKAREAVRQGASPRAALALRDLCRSYAQCLRGGAEPVTATVADVAKIARPVLRHRIFLRFQAAAQGITNDDVVQAVIDQIFKNFK